MLTKPHRQEAICRAYVQVISGQAGVSYTSLMQDYGIDAVLRTIQLYQGRHVDEGLQLDLQLKSTTRAIVEKTHIAYDLEIRAYDILRAPQPRRPRILVLFALPREEKLWVSQCEEMLSLHSCAYWLSLKGKPASKARKTVRIEIPRVQIFSVEQLHIIMAHLRQGADL